MLTRSNRTNKSGISGKIMKTPPPSLPCRKSIELQGVDLLTDCRRAFWYPMPTYVAETPPNIPGTTTTWFAALFSVLCWFPGVNRKPHHDARCTLRGLRGSRPLHPPPPPSSLLFRYPLPVQYISPFGCVHI